MRIRVGGHGPQSAHPGAIAQAGRLVQVELDLQAVRVYTYVALRISSDIFLSIDRDTCIRTVALSS